MENPRPQQPITTVMQVEGDPPPAPGIAYYPNPRPDAFLPTATASPPPAPPSMPQGGGDAVETPAVAAQLLGAVNGVAVGRIAPYLRFRPTLKKESRYLTDLEGGGTLVPITLQALDGPGEHLAADLVNQKTAEYITPDPRTGQPKNQIAAAFVLTLSENLFMNAGRIYLMQSRPDDPAFPSADPYTFEELVVISHVAPSLWEELIVWVNRLQTGDGAELKNAP